MSRKLLKRERECLEKCIEEDKGCIEQEGKKEKCTADYGKCLSQCKLRAR